MRRRARCRSSAVRRSWATACRRSSSMRPDGSGRGEFMEDVRDLKALQLDALKEVANIGAGHAATALSQLTHRRIMISVPEINIARLEEVPSLIGDPQEVVTAVLMHMLGDLTGRTLLLFSESVGREVCDMLLKRPLGTTTGFDTTQQSCPKECATILSARHLNARDGL